MTVRWKGLKRRFGEMDMACADKGCVAYSGVAPSQVSCADKGGGMRISCEVVHATQTNRRRAPVHIGAKRCVTAVNRSI